MPVADKFQFHLYAALAEQERDFIKQCTSGTLASLKARVTGGLEREGPLLHRFKRKKPAEAGFYTE